MFHYIFGIIDRRVSISLIVMERICVAFGTIAQPDRRAIMSTWASTTVDEGKDQLTLSNKLRDSEDDADDRETIESNLDEHVSQVKRGVPPRRYVDPAWWGLWVVLRAFALHDTTSDKSDKTEVAARLVAFCDAVLFDVYTSMDTMRRQLVALHENDDEFNAYVAQNCVARDTMEVARCCLWIVEIWNGMSDETRPLHDLRMVVEPREQVAFDTFRKAAHRLMTEMGVDQARIMWPWSRTARRV